jgi:hypothetical protein
MKTSKDLISSLPKGASHLRPPFQPRGQDLLNRSSRRQNGEPQASEAEHIGAKCLPQTVILSARAFCFEIKAILTSWGFDPFCPLLRWQAWT